MKIGKGGRGDSSQLLREAIAAHQGGKFFKARKLYETILADDQGNVPALHYSGILEAQQQNPAKALRLLDRALKIVPNAADISITMPCLVFSRPSRSIRSTGWRSRIREQACFLFSARPTH